MKGCRLIVNADDLGLSEAVNQGILKAHQDGIVTSTSLMPTGAAFEHAIEVLRFAPALDTGIHLTLTGEAPVSAPGEVPSLLAEDGRLHDHAVTFAKRYLTGTIRLDEVDKELDAQIRKVRDRGIEVTHLDGHQHIHMLPAIRARVGVLAERYAIPAIRYPAERVARYMLRGRASVSRLLQLLSLNAFCAAASTTDMVAPERFFGFFFGGNLTEENLLQVLSVLPPAGTCELMCHPGGHDSSGRYTHWNYHWAEELHALTSPKVMDYIATAGIELIPYSALAAEA
jgi:chitin disaccharide deacetylase